MKTLSRQIGFSLIELMVSMTIGIVLIGGAIYVFDEAQATMKVNESLARMQENARWALDVLEPDVRLSGYWGRHTSGAALGGRAQGAAPLSVTITNDCDTNWSIDTNASLEAVNNEAPDWDCVSESEYLDGTDTLAIRHASGRTIATGELEAGRLYVRTHESGAGRLFVGTSEPLITEGQNNALVAHGYYVRPNSIGTDGVPSLRRQGLSLVAGGPAVVDQEVISGVEDLQVQFGIDNNGDGSVDRYVNPDNNVLNANPRLLAVRVWVRMRADRPELGFTDTRTYTYADQEFTPDANEAAFRRLLVSRTIFLRNESIPESSL